ncbi:MAG TPA: HD domain-containing phosphohydrolase [bacterium]|nr:HD domain-containing phosphohydrolase [bacterium]
MNAERRESILIVDDAPDNLRLLSIIIKRNGMIPRPVTRGRHAIEASVVDPPDLIILDLLMPDMSGMDVCRWFKQDERLKHIPIIFISGHHEAETIVEAFRVGGVDYISKPFQEEEVIARIRTHLRLSLLNVNLESQNAQLEKVIEEQVKTATESQLATIFALAKIAETRDSDTGRHIERVQTFSRALAEQMLAMRMYATRLTSAFIETLYQTAALHDIGKVGIPDSVLLKPGKLTDEELTVMKRHCELGADTLAVVKNRYPDNQFLRMGVEIARSHQEKWDGSGYPDRLKEQNIPLSARIVSLADVYDALTSNRCYRKALSHAEVCQMIHKESGTHFDPEIVTAFGAIEHRYRQIRTELRD